MELIQLAGVNRSVQLSKDGQGFFLHIQGHDGKDFRISAPYEAAHDLITLLISISAALGKQRDAQDPMPGDFYQDRGREVKKLQVAASSDWKNVVLRLYLAENVPLGFILPRELAAGLVEDIQATEQAIALNESNPLAAPLSDDKKTRRKPRAKKRRTNH